MGTMACTGAFHTPNMETLKGYALPLIAARDWVSAKVVAYPISAVVVAFVAGALIF
jgi:hypothetical protein